MAILHRFGPACAGLVCVGSGLAPAAALVNGGNWSLPFNWSPANVPDTPGESAALNGGDVTLDGSFGIGALSLTSGSINGAGDLTATSLNWTGGRINGGGTRTITGTATLTIPAFSDLHLDTGTLTFQGNTTQGGLDGYTLYLEHQAIINNSGVYSIGNDTGVFASGNNYWNNSGTLIKNGGTGLSRCSALTINTGTLAAETGTLAVTLRGEAASGGVFTAITGATLSLSSYAGTHTLTPAATFGGSGTLQFAGVGTIDINGAHHVAGTVHVAQDGAVANFNGATTLAALKITDGTFGGSGAATATSLDWTGGSLADTGSTTVNGPATLSTLTGSTLRLSRTLTLGGATTHTGRDDYGVELQSDATLNNAGTYTIHDGTRVYASVSDGTAVFNNSGTLTKTGGAGAAGVGPLANTGTISVTSGTLAVRFAGASTAAGTLTAAPGATLSLSRPGGHALGPAVTLGGGGTFAFADDFAVAGTARADGSAFDIAALQTVAVSGTVANGGGASGTAGLTKNGGGTLALGGTATYSGPTKILAGTLRATPAAYTNLLNNAGGVDLSGPHSRLELAYGAAPNPTVAVRALLAAGRAGNFATGQIRSTIATATRGLGYRDDGSTLTVTPTLYGDADLDGGVLIGDFNVFAPNFGASGGKVWADGDFNYDGAVNIGDFNLLAVNFGQSVPAAADWAPLIAFAAAHDDLDTFAALTGVPEPASLGLAAAGATLGSRRRRRA